MGPWLTQDGFRRLPGLLLNPVTRLGEGLTFGLSATRQRSGVSEGTYLSGERDGGEGENKG